MRKPTLLEHRISGEKNLQWSLPKNLIWAKQFNTSDIFAPFKAFMTPGALHSLAFMNSQLHAEM